MNLLGIDHGDDGVESHELLELRNVQERLGNGAGVGDAGGLDQKVIESAALEELLDALYEVLADGAADAAVVHLDDLLGLVFDELAVDADGADFVDDDAEFISVLLPEDEIQKGGLAGPQEAGEDGGGYRCGILAHK